MNPNDSIVKDAALEWFGELGQCGRARAETSLRMETVSEVKA